MSLLETIKSVWSVAKQVVQLGDKVDRLASDFIEADRDNERRLRELEDRVLRLETAFDVVTKIGLPRPPNS